MPTEENKAKPNMVNISLNIPTQYNDSIQILMEYKLTPSKSEFIRKALFDFLKVKLSHFKDLDDFHEIIINHPTLEERRRYPIWQK